MLLYKIFCYGFSINLKGVTPNEGAKWHAARPGSRSRAYACLWLYAFDRDDVPCWPTCTRRTPADSCATMDRRSQSTTSSANVSVNSQRIYHLMTWTVCTSTVITRLVTVHL